MQTAPPNLLADYLYLRQTAVVKQAIDTARTSVPSGEHSSSYLCQQDSVFAAQDRPLQAVALPSLLDTALSAIPSASLPPTTQRGTTSSNPAPSRRESANHRFRSRRFWMNGRG